MRKLVLVLVVCALAVPSAAQEKPEVSDATVYLDKMATSGLATYQARQLVVYDGELAELEVRSSPGSFYVRADVRAEVTRVWRGPGHGLVEAPVESIEDEAPPAVAIRTDAVLDKYEVSIAPAEELLGAEVVPLTFVRRRDHALVEKLWVHPESGVVYRREIFGAGGKRVGWSRILEMNWGDDAEAEPFEAGAQAPSRVTAVSPGAAPRLLPYGYQLLSAYEMQAEDRPADHWIYSDGLHFLSVFRTEGSMRAPEGYEETEIAGSRAWAGRGPGTWAWEGDGSTWVVVAEEPALDPGELTSGFPHGGRSVGARLGSVWSRVFGFLGGLFS